MSTAQDVVTALLGSTVFIGGAREVWRYVLSQRAAKADAAKIAADDDRTAQTKLVDLLREQSAASEQRGVVAAERAVTIATALQAAATSQAALTREVARIPDALDTLARIPDALDGLARRLEAVERAVMDRDRHSTPVDPPRPPTGVS